jgi:general stress protein YciG
MYPSGQCISEMGPSKMECHNSMLNACADLGGILAMSAYGRGRGKSADKSKAMTVQEAGRKGGNAVKEKYGPEFYSKIGQKGGEIRGREISEAARYFREHPEAHGREHTKA